MRKVMHIVAALLLSVGASVQGVAAEAFSACPQFFANGAAPQMRSRPEMVLRPLCFDSFAVMHSGQSKTPLYVAQRLNRTVVLDAKGEERTDKFYAEARLPRAERAQLEDYKGSGMDRGHLAEAASMPSPTAMAQSFSLANMVPQDPVNNRGVWAKSVEKATRQYALRAAGDVYVITGPVFEQPVSTIGAGRVWVPKYLYKLVYDSASGRAWAHWVENSADARATRPISYEELVRRTGIEFLPGIKPRV